MEPNDNEENAVPPSAMAAFLTALKTVLYTPDGELNVEAYTRIFSPQIAEGFVPKPTNHWGKPWDQDSFLSKIGLMAENHRLVFLAAIGEMPVAATGAFYNEFMDIIARHQLEGAEVSRRVSDLAGDQVTAWTKVVPPAPRTPDKIAEKPKTPPERG